MNKGIKLSDKELIKLIKIVGKTRCKYYWIEEKIALTNKQLDYLINYKEN